LGKPLVNVLRAVHIPRLDLKQNRPFDLIRLAAHRVDRHQATGKLQNLQQFGIAVISLLFSSTTTCPRAMWLAAAQALTM